MRERGEEYGRVRAPGLARSRSRRLAASAAPNLITTHGRFADLSPLPDTGNPHNCTLRTHHCLRRAYVTILEVEHKLFNLPLIPEERQIVKELSFVPTNKKH